MEHLKTFIQKVWDGDLSFEDATEGFTKQQLVLMDAFLELHQILFRDGMPEEFELPAWVEQDYAGQLIIKLVKNWEE